MRTGSSKLCVLCVSVFQKNFFRSLLFESLVAVERMETRQESTSFPYANVTRLAPLSLQNFLHDSRWIDTRQPSI